MKYWLDTPKLLILIGAVFGLLSGVVSNPEDFGVLAIVCLFSGIIGAAATDEY